MDAQEALTQHIGRLGRMLHAGKMAPEGETVYWNACAFTESGMQVWWGDVNLTREAYKLQAAADACGEAIVITPEQPFRFSGLNGAGDWRSITSDDRARIRRFEPQKAVA